MHDQERFAPCVERASALIARYGGEVLDVVRAIEVVEGEWPIGALTALLRFPDEAALRAFWNSPENAEMKDLRHTTAKSNVATCLSLRQPWSGASDDQPASIVARDPRLEARLAPLAKENEFTRLCDQLNQQRRDLPWERVAKYPCVRRPGWSGDPGATLRRQFSVHRVSLHARARLELGMPEPFVHWSSQSLRRDAMTPETVRWMRVRRDPLRMQC